MIRETGAEANRWSNSLAVARDPSPPKVERWEKVVMGLLLAGFAAVLITLAWRVGVTVDEPAHLLSAHLYWKGQDTLRPNDMPPLIKIAGGWVSLGFPLPVPYDRKDLFTARSEWEIAQTMMERFNAPLLQRVFFLSRLPLLIFPLLACLTLWWWARRLFSLPVAALLALLFCLSPTVLGHAPLFKNDLAATLGYLLFWYRAWVYWQAPNRRNAVWLGCAVLLGVLAKLSLLILVVLAPLVVIARHMGLTGFRWRSFAGHMLLLGLIPYFGVTAAWQFESDLVSASEIRTLRSSSHVPKWAVLGMQPFRVVPTPPRLREGVISLIESDNLGAGVYLLNRVYPRGHPLYFLIAFATKVPVPLQLLFAAAIILLVRELFGRRLQLRDALWVLPPVVYLSLASFSSLQLGIRLILPALVFLFLWYGRLIEVLLKRRATVGVLVMLLVWLAARSIHQYPNYIAYFNVLAGGSDSGLQYLSDSNLDWGQDLPALAAYLGTHPIPKIRLAYFGNDNPYARIPQDRFEQIYPPWGDNPAQSTRFSPPPGYYAISATLLTGQLFSPQFRDYFGAFRATKPIAKAGYSIFIYRVP